MRWICASGRRADDPGGVIGHLYAREDAGQRAFKVLRADGAQSQLFATRQEPEGAEAEFREGKQTRDHAPGERAATFPAVFLLVSGSLEHNR